MSFSADAELFQVDGAAALARLRSTRPALANQAWRTLARLNGSDAAIQVRLHAVQVRADLTYMTTLTW